jgi:sodium pump decarboxylase gamma subunit
MISEGLTLMIAGMAVVFIFLSILVGMMHWTARVLAPHAHLFPENKTVSRASKGLAGDDSEIALVIAAIKAHCRN